MNKRQFPVHIFIENFWIFAMNQKIENILALALQTPEPVREKSLNLNVGFTEETRTWELMVKYNGNLSKAVSGLPVTKRQPFLSGKGILLAVIDSGIDYTNRNFRNAGGYLCGEKSAKLKPPGCH